MEENKNTYMEESLWEVEHFLTQESINLELLSKEQIDNMADSLMDDISLFVEENTEAEIIDEEREIR